MTETLKYFLENYPLPIVIMIWLMYRDYTQTKFLTAKLDTFSNAISDLTNQISYMLSANMNYRAGNTDIGDALSNQAIYQQKRKEKKNSADSSKDGDN